MFAIHSAILFLAPLSGFDQVLAEDETVNRLEDSVLLWKSICSNPLLGKTNLILFLNKIDIFRAKLEAGIIFGQYIISYGNRPNDYDSTSSCECDIESSIGDRMCERENVILTDVGDVFKQICGENLDRSTRNILHKHASSTAISPPSQYVPRIRPSAMIND